MNVGTKSILFGVHQLFMHPFFVCIAWYRYYEKLPTYKELFCIFCHDLGYFGKPNMDGCEGELHPELGGTIINIIFGEKYSNLTLYHSRAYAKKKDMPISMLCIPDKLSIIIYPKWLYLLLGSLSGEIKEYKMRMDMEYMSDLEWLNEIRSMTYYWSYSHCPNTYKKRVQDKFLTTDEKISMKAWANEPGRSG